SPKGSTRWNSERTRSDWASTGPASKRRTAARQTLTGLSCRPAGQSESPVRILRRVELRKSSIDPDSCDYHRQRSGGPAESLGVRSHAIDAIANLLLLGFQERLRQIEKQLMILAQRKQGSVDHQNNKYGGHRSPHEEHPHKRRNTGHRFSS